MDKESQLIWEAYQNKDLGITPKLKKLMDVGKWEKISKYKGLSEDFIRKYANKLDWDWISGFQTLSEPFIEEYSDKLDWDIISYAQNLSTAFIEKWADLIDWHEALDSQGMRDGKKYTPEKIERLIQSAPLRRLLDKDVYGNVGDFLSSI